MSTPVNTLANPVVRKQRQQEVLNTIIDLWGETGYSPSEREIAIRMRQPLTTVHTLVIDLARLGCITMVPRSPRTIVVRRHEVP